MLTGRDFAAWIGLDHSTAGKVRLGVITRAGDEMLRSGDGRTCSVRTGRSKMLLTGFFRSSDARTRNGRGGTGQQDRPGAWSLMVSGEAYRRQPQDIPQAAGLVMARRGEQDNDRYCVELMRW